MAVNFDIRSYFTAKNKHGWPTYPSNPAWYRPWDIAYTNFLYFNADDTIPLAYQYPTGQDYDSGLRINVESIEITDTLDQGSWMKVELRQCHDRDFLEVADNEAYTLDPVHNGEMLPRFQFPCRVWDCKLSGIPNIQTLSGTVKFTSGSTAVEGISGTSFITEVRPGQLIRCDSYPNLWYVVEGNITYNSLQITTFFGGTTTTDSASKDNAPAYFAGMLSQVDILPVSDVAISGIQDGIFKIAFEFDSFDNFFLRYDIGAPLWYHRANATTNGYHWAFTTQDDITFDDIIDLIVNDWMNVGRPSIDFPVTYQYIPIAVAPYTTNIKKLVPKALTGSLTWTNSSATVTGDATSKFQSEVSVGLLISPDANMAISYTVVSIESDTSLTISSNFTGGTVTCTSYFNLNWVAVVECKDRPTWDILRDVLTYMGALEGNLKKYIPYLTYDPVTMIADIAPINGGFDKTAPAEEDLSQEVTMNSATSTAIAFSFNRFRVPFSGMNDNEYWLSVTLYKSDGAGGWNTVTTIPALGYEYYKFDSSNTHSSRDFKVPTQEAGTYKWVADLVTGGSFTIAVTGGKAYSPPIYTFPTAPTAHKYKDLKTFAVTQGRCSMLGIYKASNLGGCKSGGTTTSAEHANTTNECPDQQGCYPDVSVETALTGTITTGIGTAVTGTGTAFTTQLEPGFLIKRTAAGSYVMVKSIESDTALTLVSNYGSAGGPGAGTFKEGFNPNYGLRGIATIYADTSIATTVNTPCRLNSKRLYSCYLNYNSSIRIPAEIKLDFDMGWTDKLIGLYIEVFNIILNESVIFRCTEQVNTLKGNNVTTSIKLYRV